ncbi:MAG: YkgJ family cysteine cluster protein [Candidatus Sumerlaeota bacterium]|nr:YkgJ family cysteine cluster protein [Candidatus Sumerlaeota bacterium]
MLQNPFSSFAREESSGRLQLEATPQEDDLAGFACRRCGNCCRGEGYVWLNANDVERISRILNLDRKVFLTQYTQRIHGFPQPCLLNKDDAAISCIFLEESGCRVHAAKPRQCATFPFAWTREDAEEICEGIKAGKDR